MYSKATKEVFRLPVGRNPQRSQHTYAHLDAYAADHAKRLNAPSRELAKDKFLLFRVSRTMLLAGKVGCGTVSMVQGHAVGSVIARNAFAGLRPRTTPGYNVGTAGRVLPMNTAFLSPRFFFFFQICC